MHSVLGKKGLSCFERIYIGYGQGGKAGKVQLGGGSPRIGAQSESRNCLLLVIGYGQQS